MILGLSQNINLRNHLFVPMFIVLMKLVQVPSTLDVLMKRFCTSCISSKGKRRYTFGSIDISSDEGSRP